MRSHEIPSACANSVQAYATSVKATLSKFLQFSTMGDDSPSPTPTSEARGREKSSKEDKKTTEVRKSGGTSTSLKGGKRSLASKDSRSKGTSNVTLNAATLGSVIAEALKSSFEGLRDSMNAGFYWPGRPDCLAR